jgi:hypothetical protein
MGGAIFSLQGTLAITNSTVVSNTALAGEDNVKEHAKGIAGAVFNMSGNFTASASTFVGNTASDYASQIFNLVYDGHTERAAIAILRDTIVANGIGPSDLASDKTSYIFPAPLGSANADVSRFDLVRATSAMEQGTITGVPLVADPLLGPLRSNGGPTDTMAPMPGSPAIDTGNSFGLSTDQRGDARPVDFFAIPDAIGGDGSDIGAVELQQACGFQGFPTEACHTLVVSLTGSGTGTVTGAGVSCPGNCSTSYGAATTVHLTAAPAPGSAFSGWSGECSGSGGCAVTMGADQAVVATFTFVGAPPPVISAVSQTASRWREGGKLVQISRRARRQKVPIGTTFSFTLNEQAAATFTFTKRHKGRSARGRCAAGTRRASRRKPCTRTTIAGELHFNGHSGANDVAFDGRLSPSKRLPPGRYTLVVGATNGAGQRSNPQRISFTIVK